MRARAESRVLPIVTENCMQGLNGHRPGCPLRLLTVHAQVSLPHSCTSNPPPFVLSLSKHERWSAHILRYANATLPPSETFAIPLPPCRGKVGMGVKNGLTTSNHELPMHLWIPAFAGKTGLLQGLLRGIPGGLRTRQPLIGMKSQLPGSETAARPLGERGAVC